VGKKKFLHPMNLWVECRNIVLIFLIMQTTIYEMVIMHQVLCKAFCMDCLIPFSEHSMNEESKVESNLGSQSSKFIDQSILVFYFFSLSHKIIPPW
jgi:hypothetical protein